MPSLTAPAPTPTTTTRLLALLRDVAPMMVALLSLITLLWAAYWMIRLPHTGFGGIKYLPLANIEPNSPADGTLNVGDRILAVAGNPVELSLDALAHVSAGDVLDLRIQAPNGDIRNEVIHLVGPTSLAVVFDRFSLLLVAAAFWLAGVAVAALLWPFGAGDLTGTLVIAFVHLIAVFMATSTVSSYLMLSAGFLVRVSALWLGVVALQLHLRFPVPIRTILGKGFWGVCYGLCALLSALLAILVYTQPDHAASLLAASAGAQAIWLFAGLIVILLILTLGQFAPRTEEHATERRTIAIVSFVGFAPLLLFTLGPQALLRGHGIDASFTVLPLAAIPFGYAYAILRYRLIRYDGRVSRAVGYLIAVALLAVLLVAIVFALIALGLAPTGPAFIVILVVLAGALAVVFEPARRRIQDGVDAIFYRQYEGFRSTLKGVDQALAASPDVTAWALALCQQFATALEVHPVGLLYRVAQGKAFRLAAHDPTGAAAALPVEIDALAPLIAQLATWAEPCNAVDLRAALDRPGLSEAERAWLGSPAFDLWWPILAHGALQAVLVLGRKASPYAPEEVELIALASRQIGAALENAQFARELEQLSRAALQTREDERRRVSRELHDHIIQPLVSLNFSLAAARDVPEAAEARGQISDLITHVRRISADLRPPALDEVGLAAAARGLARTFARTQRIVCDLAVRPDEDLELPEPLASTFYSALREALNNIAKHAQASRVSVLLEAEAGWLTLVVHDDGRGFTPPGRLGQLAPAGHFGLLGLQERLAAVDGTLTIHAEPGQGTRLECRAPLQPV